MKSPINLWVMKKLRNWDGRIMKVWKLRQKEFMNGIRELLKIINNLNYDKAF